MNKNQFMHMWVASFYLFLVLIKENALKHVLKFEPLFNKYGHFSADAHILFFFY